MTSYRDTIKIGLGNSRARDFLSYLLYGIDLELRAFSVNKKCKTDIKTVPVYSHDLAKLMLEMDPTSRYEYAEALCDTSPHHAWDSWYRRKRKSLKTEKVPDPSYVVKPEFIEEDLYMWCHGDFLFEVEKTKNHITYDLFGFNGLHDLAMRRFAKDNFSRYRIRESRQQQFANQKITKKPKEIRIETSDVLFMTLIGKRVSADEMLERERPIRY